MDRDLKEISNGMRKYENGLLVCEIDLVKVEYPQVKLTELENAWKPFWSNVKFGGVAKPGGTVCRAAI